MERERIDVATGALGSLLPKLELLLEDGFKHNLPKSARHDIHLLLMELKMICTVLRRDFAEEQKGQMMKLWALDVQELSYDVEDAVDNILVRLKGLESTEASSTRSRLRAATTHKLFDEIKDIKSRVREVCEMRDQYMIRIDDSLHKPQVSTIYNPPSLPDRLYVDQHSLVGIDQAADELIGMLALEGDAFERRLKWED